MISQIKSQITTLSPLPQPLPFLLIGHGTRDEDGRQAFLDFATAYQELDRSRPVIPCFLELTQPSIAAGVEQCLAQGYTDMTAVPLLLFAARHSKFDVTNELDRIRQVHPEINYRYGRHLGIMPGLLDLWRDRLSEIERSEQYLPNISREDTVILFVGRGSSDPDANSDVCKFARILWEGSGYKNIEVCFIGITHPRLEEGFRRAMFYKPKRIIVLPYFLFTGALVKKIYSISEQMRTELPDCPEIINLAEIGIDSQLFHLVRDREIEAQLGEVKMNCEMCKFRLAAVSGGNTHSHDHHHHDHDHPHSHHHEDEHSHEHSHSHQEHQHNHSHNHAHDHGITWQDAYPEPDDYHTRAWQVP